MGIHVIAGKINSGKSTRLLSIYREMQAGDGFVINKIFASNFHNYSGHIGQKIVRLSTGESQNFSFKKDFLPDDWDEKCSFGPYSFSKKGILFADRVASELIAKDTEPIYIDEIGPLELQGEGLAQIFARILLVKKDIYVAIREHCVEKVINKFNIDKTHDINILSLIP